MLGRKFLPAQAQSALRPSLPCPMQVCAGYLTLSMAAPIPHIPANENISTLSARRDGDGDGYGDTEKMAIHAHDSDFPCSL